MQISSGPFVGTEVPESELEPALDRAGNPKLDRSGKPLLYWPTHQRVRRLLEQFNPKEGWCVVVEVTPGTFSVPSTTLKAADGSSIQQPTQVFTSKLINPEGHAVANAFVLQVMDSMPAWPAGQTRARGALCDALGLSIHGVFGQSEEAAEAQEDPAPVAFKVEAVVAPASVVPDTTSTPTAPAPAPEPVVSTPVAAAPIVSETPAPAVTAPAANAESAPQPEPKTEAPVAKAPTKVVVPQPPKAADQQASAAPVKLNVTLLRQATACAKLRGVSLPEFASNDELRAFYKDLVSGQKAVSA